MVKKIFFGIAAFAFYMKAEAQNDFPLKGFLRAQATISPGFMLNSSEKNIYIHGDLEFYPEDHISIRGESYVLVGGDNSRSGIDEFTNFFGASYHFGKNHFDPYLGFQPGLAFRSYKRMSANPELINPPHGFTVSPEVSLIGGINFYLNKYLHVFGMVRFINGTDASFADKISLNELRFSAGLGWNIPTMKS